jgi:hypothetical protein
MAMSAKYAHDLAISALPDDGPLLDDLLKRVSSRLDAGVVTTNSASLNEDRSLIAVVLARRQWGSDRATAAAAEILESRARKRRKSIVVVSLDDELRPSWMRPLARVDLAETGIEGVADFLVTAVAEAGGHLRVELAEPADAEEPAYRWMDGPRPFLEQPRAQGALRKAFDALCAELEPQFDVGREASPDHKLELLKLPNRLIARVDGFGVSFSWLGARSGVVSEGRLMVIEWNGLSGRGAAAMKTARPVREQVYLAEASGNDDWHWRSDAANGRASTTADLAAEWVASVSLAARTGARTESRV